MVLGSEKLNLKNLYSKCDGSNPFLKITLQRYGNKMTYKILIINTARILHFERFIFSVDTISREFWAFPVIFFKFKP